MSSRSSPSENWPSGIGAGPLSAAARRRLERPGPVPLRPPPAGERTAVARWRAEVHRAWLAGDPPAGERGHRAAVVGGIRCLRTRPIPGPLVVYFHGGGYALGSPEVAVPITDRLAGRIEVVSVDYRLAPEHPFPAAVDDGWAVVDAVRRHEPRRPIVLSGDSAGANLALSIALRMGRGGGGAAALVLFSPHLDHSPGPPDRHLPLGDLDAEGAAWLRSAYCGGLDPADPRVSPLRADLAGLPPTLVQVGTRDTSLTQSVRFSRLARRAGAPVVLDVWDGLWHTWHYHRDLPEADLALAEAADFVTGLPVP